MSHIPNFYNPDQIGTLFYPNQAQIADDAAAADLPPAAGDQLNVHLVLIDMQIDFCHEQGSLYVPGALGDIRRVCEFIFRHAGQITRISATLDSHLPYQIFHPPWWVDADGNHPPPFTLISHDDVLAGRWRATIAPDYSAAYTRELEQRARKILTIWPYHTMIGGLGNALDPMLWSTVVWHAMARDSQPAWIQKGTIPQTEHYSAIQPEIPVPGHPGLGSHTEFLESIDRSDLIVVAGEAESHCVLATVGDIVQHLTAQQQPLDKLVVLQDCMSPVLHPQIDFHKLAWAQYVIYREQGVQFVDSDSQIAALERQSNRPGTADVRGVDLIIP